MIKYLEISVMGSVTVLLVMLIRLVLQNRVRRSTILLFWMIALARFLIPVSVSSPVSVYNLPVFQGQKITLPPPMVQITGSPQETAHNLPYIEIETVLTSQRTEAATSSQEAGTMLPYLDTETASPLRGSEAVPLPPLPPRDSTVVVSSTSSIPVTCSRITITGLLPYLWLGSSALVLLFFAISHLRSLWRYQFSLPAAALPTAIPKGVRVRILDDLPTPLTYGIFRPVILLPPALLQDDPKDLEHILRHELSHIRHRDVAVKGLMLLAVALHWFNPFVWLLFFAASRDMEMRCDEDVVAQLGQGGKLAYARTLVSIEQKKLVGYLQTGFSFGSTAGRLKAMAGAKPNTAISALAAVCLSLCLIFGFCTTRAAEVEISPSLQQTEDVDVPEDITESAEPDPAKPREANWVQVPMLKEPATVMQTEPVPEETEPPTEPEPTPQTQYSPPPQTPEKTEDEPALITWETMTEEQRRIIQEQAQQNMSNYVSNNPSYSLLDDLSNPGGATSPVIIIPGPTPPADPAPQPENPGAPTDSTP